jgi:hypothetical protein
LTVTVASLEQCQPLSHAAKLTPLLPRIGAFKRMGTIVALALTLATAHARSQSLATMNYAAAKTVTSPTHAIAETTDHVVSITLDSSHGGWVSKHYAATIERSRAGFVLDGEAVDNAKVSALLDAVRSRARRVPNEQIANLTEYVIDHCASALSGEFGSRMQDKAFSAAALPACKSGAEGFIQRYLSPSNFSFHTDDYPEEAVVISFDDGYTVSALSRSQNAFMLPWRVIGPSFQGLIYDTTIARCVVALFGNKDVNADRMSPDALAAAYAENLNIQPPTSLPSPPAVAPNTPLQSAMTAANVFAVWSEANDATGRITGEIGSSRWGGISASFDCPVPTDKTSAASCLAVPIEQGDRLAALSWIRAISLRPQLRVQIVNGDFASYDVRDLSRLAAARADIAALLPAARASGIFFWIIPRGRLDIDGTSNWVLLPDKRLILISYNRGPLMRAAGLDESRLGGTGWLRRVGALFTSDGVLTGPVAGRPMHEGSSDVATIVVQSRSHGRATRTTVAADANGTFQAGKRTVSAAAISRLLSAAHSQASSPLPSMSRAEATTLLRACDQITRQQLGAFTSSSKTRTLFEQRCRDAHNLASFLEDYNNSPDGLLLDDGFNGGVQVAITYRSGSTLKVSSDSHLAYMIPWSVTGAGVPRTSYDPDIGIAIAALTDRSDPNLTRLDGSVLPQQYGTDIRQKLYQYLGHPAELPSAAILTPALRRYALAQGYLLQNLAYDRGANSVIGMVSSRKWHSNIWVQFRCPVSATKHDLPATLAPSIILGTRLATIAWIRQALRRSELSVMAYPWASLQKYPYTDDDVAPDFDNWPDSVPGLSAAAARRLSRSPGVAWFALEQPQPIALSLVGGQFSSDWMLLPNGTAVLGLYTLGLPEYIGISAQIPNFGEGIQRYAGVFVNPTGSLQPQPSVGVR